MFAGLLKETGTSNNQHRDWEADATTAQWHYGIATDLRLCCATKCGAAATVCQGIAVSAYRLL